MELLVFNELNQDPVVQGLFSVFNGMETGRMDAARTLIRFAEKYGISGNLPRLYIAEKLAESENVLTQTLEKYGQAGSSLITLALWDLQCLFDTFFDNEDLFEAPLSEFYHYAPSIKKPTHNPDFFNSIQKMASAKTPEQLYTLFSEHIKSFGCGTMSRYTAFRYAKGVLSGIVDPDPITFDKLIGIDWQRDLLMENVRHFISGRGANNVILFGDSGTGKSSSVKALYNHFCHENLRLIEVQKESLGDLPMLYARLQIKKDYYLLFIDDLSFETNDAEFKALKSILEGQIEPQPENVLLHATSNLRHLVKERWSDRSKPYESDEVHPGDNLQELMSLSERFGLSISYAAPNQKEYLAIVEGLLLQHQIAMTEDIRRAALQWELHYNGKSGRTAMQFVRKWLGTLRVPVLPKT